MAELLVRVYVLVDDAVASGAVAVPPRPGPLPRCSDAEVLTVAVVRHLLGRPSERAFLAEVRRDWAAYFPVLPAQSEFNRRVRWLWGAFEALRQRAAAAAPEDPWQQVDTTAPAYAVDDLRRIPVPTLWIAGENDPWCELDQPLALKRHIPGAELLLVNHAGHGPQLTHPHLVGPAIADFLSRNDAPPRP